MASIDLHRVKTDGHTICLGRHSLGDLSEVLSDEAFLQAKVFILCDENTLQQCLPSAVSKVPALQSAEILEVPEGEESKSIEVCTQLWHALSDMGADRYSVLINLGGGVVTDLGGFVAGTYKRGIRFFNLPTSLLGQVDASVGGKVGIDLGHLKNQVGLFNQPNGVYVDPSFLSTLPRAHLLSGFSEMIKHALVCSPGYWEQLKEVSFYDMESLEQPILRSVQIKNEIVCSDPYETGMRKILNFGHTIGHAIESYSLEGDMKTILHGEAVAMGMVCESFISHRRKLLSEEDLGDITSFIFSHFTKVQVDTLQHHRLIELMRHDKKNRGGKVMMSLLQNIGDCLPDQDVPADHIIESLNFYERWVG